MPSIDEQRYFVIPLSVQKEGEDYIVGNADLDDFYQFPEQALRIINLLRIGNTAATIKSTLANESSEMVDVDDFIAQLTSMGFIYPEEEKQQFQNKLEIPSKDRRIVFKANPRLSRALFSLPGLACYLAVAGYALFCIIQNPGLLSLHAFYFEKNFTLILVLLLLMYFVTVSLHELGHMLAAARYGINSKLGIGNRLWTIVAEADLTGILTLPKNQRYLPLLAGMLVDILNISLLVILIKFLRQSGASPFTVQLLQALILQIVITMSWQFNIFLRTDIYYVLCNYFSCSDLDRDARRYLRTLFYKVSYGRFGEKADSEKHKNIAILRAFTVIWVVGRVCALILLFGVYIPTLLRYAARAYRGFSGPSVGTAYDGAVFVSISLVLLIAGMYMWLKRRPQSNYSKGEAQ